MAAKTILVLCAQALLAQVSFSQCLGRTAGIAAPYGIGRAGWPYDNLATDVTAAPYGTVGPACGAVAPVAAVAPLAGVAPASGGGLPIASASPIPVTGLSVASDNAIEGVLSVAGEMPFVSAVALEGALPTAGDGSVMYGCGDGSISIVSESSAPALGLADGLTYGTGLAAPFSGLPARGLAGPARGLAGPGFGIASPAFGRCGGAVY